MQATPLVSIIIPTFNRAGVLPKALDSVLTQEYHDWELIVVDDGSTDDTPRVIADYQRRIPALRYVRQTNRKQAAARNHGMRLARGKYLAFLDSDDEWLPGKLRRQAAILDTHPEIGMVYGNQLMATGDGAAAVRRYPSGFLPSGNIFKALLKREFYCSLQSVMLRRTVVETVGPLDESLGDSLEDWEFTLRIASRFPVSAIDDPVCLRHVNDRYDRAYALRRIRNHRAILEKTFAAIPLPARERQYLWRQCYYTWGVALLQAGYYPRSAGWFLRAALGGHARSLGGVALAVSGPLGSRLYRRMARRQQAGMDPS